MNSQHGVNSNPPTPPNQSNYSDEEYWEKHKCTTLCSHLRPENHPSEDEKIVLAQPYQKVTPVKEPNIKKLLKAERSRLIDELEAKIKAAKLPSPTEWLKLKAELKAKVGSEVMNDMPMTYVDGCIDGYFYAIDQVKKILEEAKNG